MAQAGDVYSGVFPLTNRTTGEPLDVAMLITVTEEALTYTIQTIDRTYSETITAPLGGGSIPLAVLTTIESVARHAHDAVRRRR